MVMSMFVAIPQGYASAVKGVDAVAIQAAVNINVATVEELQKIPEVGKTTAERIVAYRSEQGPFNAPEDLVKVKGIGSKKFEKMKDYVVVK